MCTCGFQNRPDHTKFLFQVLLDRDGRFALTDFSFEDRFEQLFVEILQKEERGKLQQPKEGVDEWWK